MKKLILIGCALVLVVAAVIFFGLSNLGPIIKNRRQHLRAQDHPDRGAAWATPASRCSPVKSS
jgi:lipopolysaccharide export LptBFGC system permease protein LptF